MKVTLDLDDSLLDRARRHADATGRSLDALVEAGLHAALPAPPPTDRYHLPDLSVGRPGATDPLEGHSLAEIRDIIYGADDDQEPRRRLVEREALLERWKNVPPGDPATLPRDIDDSIDPSL